LETPEKYVEFKNNIDYNSIKTTTLLSFVVFAVFLLTIVWALASFFTHQYYQKMRTQEIMRVATSFQNEYYQNPYSIGEYAIQTAGSNGIYIRLDDAGESLIFDGTTALKEDARFEQDIKRIKKKLKNSNKGEVYSTVNENTTDSEPRLVYASYIRSTYGYGVLYIIAPLVPDESTVNIIKNMLMYITFIVLVIAIVIAAYLSGRLAKPIEDITASASELSRGNHDIKFDGGSFTETKALAKTLNKASYEIEKTEFYQREILANVSHDLKTPLTMIRSYAEKIIDISGDNPSKRESDLHVIISETERLNRLVTEMMTVSNLQSNNVELHKETFDIVEAANEVFESFQVLNSSEGFDIQFHPCKSTLVEGDKTRLVQVMSNFVSNAVKYSGDNKYVDIQLKRNGSKTIAFHCIDHGVGIPAEEQQHVWDRYYRTSANHERDIEGTGLGLSIVKGILALHNANFGVNSQEGKGSDFWFELDIVKKTTNKESKIKKKDGKEE